MWTGDDKSCIRIETVMLVLGLGLASSNHGLDVAGLVNITGLRLSDA
jgi:hypothetical protein